MMVNLAITVGQEIFALYKYFIARWFHNIVHIHILIFCTFDFCHSANILTLKISQSMVCLQINNNYFPARVVGFFGRVADYWEVTGDILTSCYM